MVLEPITMHPFKPKGLAIYMADASFIKMDENKMASNGMTL